MLRLKTTDNAPGPQGANCTWIKCAGLITVFVAAQLGVGLKYFHVGLMQAQARIHGEHFKEVSDATGSEGFGQIAPGFPTPSPGRFSAGAFQRDFENAAQKNFPRSDTTLIPFYRSLSAKLSHLSLSAVPGFSTTSQPLLAGCTLMRAADGERICGPPTAYHQANHAKLAQRASYYHDLHATWPQVRFYVFPALPVADWFVVGNACGSEVKKCLAGDRYVREFRDLLDPAVGYAWAAEGCCAQDAISYYYKTDHHWDFRGAYKIYRQLWGLLQQRNSDLGPPWEPKRWIELPDLIFRGSLACRAGYYDAVGDVIVDGVFDLPELKVHIYGFEERQRNAKQRYEAGQYTKGRFAYHYAGYFGTDYGLIEYTCADPGHGRLLVISDSLDNSIEPLLASHFSHTWFADLRLYTQDLGKEFDMDDFLASHGITDVLFLGFQDWVLGLSPIGPYQ